MALSPGLFARARLPRTLPPTTGPVGNGMDNDPADVEAVKRGLNALGYYDVPDYGLTGFIDQATTDAVKRFQQDHGLKQDGWLAPGGETDTALKERLGTTPEGEARKEEGTQPSEEETAPAIQRSAAPAQKGISLLDYRPGNAGAKAFQVAQKEGGGSKPPEPPSPVGVPSEAPTGNLPSPKNSPATTAETHKTQKTGSSDPIDSKGSQKSETAQSQQRVSGPGLSTWEIIGSQKRSANGERGHGHTVKAEELVAEGKTDDELVSAQRDADYEFWIDQEARAEAEIKTPKNSRAAKLQQQALQIQKDLADKSVKDVIIKGILSSIQSFEGPRGGPHAIDDLLMFAQKCADVIQQYWPKEAQFIEHSHGAYQDGTGGRLPEWRHYNQKVKEAQELAKRTGQPYRPPELGKNERHFTQSDLGYTYRGGLGPQFQQVSTLKDGHTPTKEEAISLANMINFIGAQYVNVFPKKTAGTNRDDARRIAEQACFDGFTKILGTPFTPIPAWGQ